MLRGLLAGGGVDGKKGLGGKDGRRGKSDALAFAKTLITIQLA